MKEPKWLYRLESSDPQQGLWYDASGDFVWTIGMLSDCQTRFLPMGYDERYQKDGRSWYSSCSNPEDLAHWFSLSDALALMEKGFVSCGILPQNIRNILWKPCSSRKHALPAKRLIQEGCIRTMRITCRTKFNAKPPCPFISSAFFGAVDEDGEAYKEACCILTGQRVHKPTRQPIHCPFRDENKQAFLRNYSIENTFSSQEESVCVSSPV